MAGGASAQRDVFVEKVLAEIGLGRFQLILYFTVGLAVLADGSEMLVISLITRGLQEEWNLSSVQKGLMGSSIFLGFAIGSVAGGTIADRFGRRFPMLAATSGLFVMGFASAFATSYSVLLVLRAFVGAAVGMMIPLAVSIIVEVCPTYARGKLIVLNSVFFALGEVMAAVIGWCVRGSGGGCSRPRAARARTRLTHPRLPGSSCHTWNAATGATCSCCLRSQRSCVSSFRSPWCQSRPISSCPRATRRRRTPCWRKSHA